MKRLHPVAILFAASSLILAVSARGHGSGHGRKSGSAAGGGARTARSRQTTGQAAGTTAKMHKFNAIPVGIPGAEMDDGIDRSHSWCQLVMDISSGKVPFKGALQGKNVSIVFPDQGGPLSVKYNRSSGMIEGGVTVEIFEEISRRAGFNWHYNVAVVDYIDRELGETDDQFLEWAVNSFDLTDWFVITPDRSEEGITFAYPFINMSPHLVATVKRADAPLYLTVVSIFKPFKTSLWACVIMFFVFSAAVYIYLERGNDDIQQKTTVGGMAQSLFLTVASFTGGGGFTPQTAFGKLFALSWTFLVLLLISAYTANLASEMVVTASRYEAVHGIEDANARHVSVCARRGSIYHHIMKSRYPGVPLHLVNSEIDKFEALRAKKCVAGVVSQVEWEFEQGMTDYNAGCQFDTIGRNVMELQGSFAAEAADATKCKEVVVEIITSFMHEMYLEGAFDQVRERYKARCRDMTCPSGGQRGDDQHLSEKDMAGAFAMHVIISLLCVLGACFLTKVRAKAEVERDTDSDESSGYEEMKIQ